MNMVVYLGPSHALKDAQTILEPRWPVIAPDPSESVGACLDAAVAVLVASMRVRFDRPTLDRAPRLRVVSTATTGADHIDVRVLADRRIPLFTLKGETELLRSFTPAARTFMAASHGLRPASSGRNEACPGWTVETRGVPRDHAQRQEAWGDRLWSTRMRLR